MHTEGKILLGGLIKGLRCIICPQHIQRKQCVYSGNKCQYKYRLFKFHNRKSALCKNIVNGIYCKAHSNSYSAKAYRFFCSGVKVKGLIIHSHNPAGVNVVYTAYKYRKKQIWFFVSCNIAQHTHQHCGIDISFVHHCTEGKHHRYRNRGSSKKSAVASGTQHKKCHKSQHAADDSKVYLSAALYTGKLCPIKPKQVVKVKAVYGKVLIALKCAFI